MDRITCRFIYNDELLGDILVKPYKSARYVKFRISDGTVSATVPFAVPLQTFVSDLQELKPKISARQSAQKVCFRDGVVFSSCWLTVMLEHGDVKDYTVRGKLDRYFITAPEGENDNDLIKNGIYCAMKHRARQVLPPLVKELALKHGFQYRSVKINSSRGRWGSCSSIGNINLSLSLMALPRRLTAYVIMHELCHTRFMSHDDNFYRLLDKCAGGESERMKAELRRYTTWVKCNSDNSLE